MPTRAKQWRLVVVLLLCCGCDDEAGHTGDRGDTNSASPDAAETGDAADARAEDASDVPDEAGVDTGDGDSQPEADEDARDAEAPDAAETTDDADAAEAYGCADTPLLGSQLWPPAATIQDQATLDVEVLDSWTQFEDLTNVRVQELRYTSWEVVDCEVNAIRIEAFYAIPVALEGGAPDAGLVVAHGLGGCGSADGAAGRAADLGMGVIYYTGPGNCNSEGRGNDDPMGLFDTAEDARGSWFWGHAVAGGRALTVLETLADIDPDRLAMTGYSAGSVATLNVNGFDDRLVATIPISAAGGWRSATANGGWQNDLLESAGITADSVEYQTVLATVDPINQAPTQHGAVLLVNGAQDEFFPIDGTVATFEAFPGDAHRIVIIPNWDHGLFALDLPNCLTFDNQDSALERVDGAVAFWLGRHVLNDGDFDELPPLPSAALTDLAGFAALSGTLDTDYEVVEVYWYASTDRAYTFLGTELEDVSGESWTDIDSGIPFSLLNDTTATYLAEFRLRVDALGLRDFWITSVPHLAADLQPRIRPTNPLECN